MRYTLLVLVIACGFYGVAGADTIEVTFNGMACSLCGTSIEESFRAQPEVAFVVVDPDNNLLTIRTRRARTIDDAKIKMLLGHAGYSVVRILRQK